MVGKDRAGASLIEPLQLELRQHEDAAQDQLADLLRMLLRVRERERRAPRAAEPQPALDAEMRPQLLDVRHQVPSGVVDQAGVRPAAPTAAVIAQHDAIRIAIEETAGAHSLS